LSYVLETERLYLRYFKKGDGDHFFSLNNHPEAIKYTGDQPFKTLKKAHEFIASYDAYEKTGIGRYAVIRREDDAFLGWCGLKYNEDVDLVDVGYRFYPKYWGNGYATESAEAVLDYALNTLKIPQLIARTHADNIRSQKIAKNIGLLPIEEITHQGVKIIVHHLNNWDYEIRQIGAEETWTVRHPVLRKGRPLEDVYMEADEQETTFHLGAFYKKELVGVASFMQDSHPDLEGNQMRLRGMGVLSNFRRKGIAGILLRDGEIYCKKRDVQTLWFNAREVAVSFYKRHNYTIESEQFEIPLVGPHYRMKKEL